MYDNTVQKQSFASRLNIQEFSKHEGKFDPLYAFLQRAEVLESIIRYFHNTTILYTIIGHLFVSEANQYQICLKNTYLPNMLELEIVIDAEIDEDGKYIPVFSFYLQGIRYPNLNSNRIDVIFYKSQDEVLAELCKALKIG